MSRFMVGRIGAVLVSSMALAGCLGSGGGGGGAAAGGGAGGATGSVTSPSAHNARFETISSTIATTDMPTTGSANYRGSVNTILRENTTEIGSLLGDVEFTANFGTAFNDMTQQSVNGRVHNIRGTVGGEDVVFEGELTTAAAEARGFISTMQIQQNTISVPGVPTQNLTTGGITASFVGDLEVEDRSGPVILNLGGNFVGAGGSGAFGPAGGQWWGPGNPTQYTVGGTWYAERQ